MSQDSIFNHKDAQLRAISRFFNFTAYVYTSTIAHGSGGEPKLSFTDSGILVKGNLQARSIKQQEEYFARIAVNSDFNFICEVAEINNNDRLVIDDVSYDVVYVDDITYSGIFLEIALHRVV